MTEHFIETIKTARYCTIGEPDQNTTAIWFVLHGHGHLAKFFIKKFETLKDEQTVIVAPEGLSRFYLNGFSGRVGATWMTKEDRLNDIKDYVQFLNTLYAQVTEKLDLKKASIHLLGFSQGSATVSRWARSGKVKIDKFILWAGLFPPDMDFEVDKLILNESKIYLVCGNQDQFMTPYQFKLQTTELDRHGLNYKVLNFEGKHDIDPATLTKISLDKD